MSIFVRMRDNVPSNESILEDVEIEDSNVIINKLAQVTFNRARYSDNNDLVRDHVFGVSRFRQISRGFSIFLRLICCLLYILQGFTLDEIPNIGPSDPPSHCFSIPYYSFMESETYYTGTISKCEAMYTLIDSTIGISSFKANFDHYDCQKLCTPTNYTLNSICNQHNCKCAFDCNSTILCGKYSYLDESITRLIFNRTYVKHDNYNYFNLIFFPRRIEIYFAQAFFAILVLFLTIFETIYECANGILWFRLLTLDFMLDFIIGLMYFATLCYLPCFKDIFIPLFLTAIPGSKIVHEIIYENDPYDRASRWNTPLFQNMLNLVIRIITLLFITVCLLHYLERAYPASDIKNLFDSFWFSIITITTVGYGDIVVQTWMARLTVISLVIFVILNLPNTLSDFLSSFQSSKQLYKVFSNDSNQHIVIVISQVRDCFLIDFLNEYYAVKTNTTATVILSVKKPLSTSTINHKLKSPIWKKKVKLLVGSALKSIDLKRVALNSAKLVFVISERHCENLIKSDQETILRARSIHNLYPNSRLFVHILLPINRFYLDFATKIICEGELKYAIFASNSICPGFSSFLSLILHTRSEDDNKGLTYSEDYNKCSANEIYEIKLKDSKVFQSYEGSHFLYASVQAHRSSNLLLIGVKSCSQNRILLNPGPDYFLEANDTCFYLSLKDESYIDFTPEYKSQEALEFICARMGLLHMRLYNVDVDHMIENENKTVNIPAYNNLRSSEYAKDLTIAHGIQKLTTAAASSRVSTLHLPLFSPIADSVENVHSALGYMEVVKGTNNDILPDIAVAPDANNANHALTLANMQKVQHENELQAPKQTIHDRPSTVKEFSKKLSKKLSFVATKVQTPVFPKTYRDQNEKMEMTKLELNQPTIEERFKMKSMAITESFEFEPSNTRIDYLPIRQYVGVTNFRCHIRKHQLSLCCLQFGWKRPCIEKSCYDVFPCTRTIYNPDRQGPQSLYPSNLKNAIILCANIAGTQIFHFIIPLRTYHLKTEDLVPIVLLLHERPDLLFLEAISWIPSVYYMIGSESNPEDLIIAGILNAKGVVICVGDCTNIESLEPHMIDAPRINAALIVSRLFPRISFYIELIHRQNIKFLRGNRLKYTKIKRNNRVIAGEFMDSPCFMSGQVFSPSLLETILYQSCSKDYIIDLVRIMLGLDQTHGCASLSKHIVTRQEVHELKEYSRLMIRLACETKELAFAIYRTDLEELPEREIKKNQGQNNKAAEFIKATLKRLNIPNDNEHDFNDCQRWKKQSYILPNPPATFKILEDDVILLFRPLTSNDISCFSFSPIHSISQKSFEITDFDDDFLKPRFGERFQKFMRKGSKDKSDIREKTPEGSVCELSPNASPSRRISDD